MDVGGVYDATSSLRCRLGDPPCLSVIALWPCLSFFGHGLLQLLGILMPLQMFSPLLVHENPFFQRMLFVVRLAHAQSCYFISDKCKNRHAESTLPIEHWKIIKVADRKCSFFCFLLSMQRLCTSVGGRLLSMVVYNCNFFESKGQYGCNFLES